MVTLVEKRLMAPTVATPGGEVAEAHAVKSRPATQAFPL